MLGEPRRSQRGQTANDRSRQCRKRREVRRIHSPSPRRSWSGAGKPTATKMGTANYHWDRIIRHSWTRLGARLVSAADGPCPPTGEEMMNLREGVVGKRSPKECSSRLPGGAASSD